MDISVYSQNQKESQQQLLQNLMDDIFDVVGVRVSLSSTEGVSIAHTEYQCEFCQTSLKDPAKGGLCRKCAVEAIRRANDQRDVFFYRCWRGLMNATIAVNVNDRPLGGFVISGFVSSPETMEDTEQLFPDPDLQVSEEELKGIQFLERGRVRDVISTVSIAAKYLGELYQRHAAEDAQRMADFRALQSQINPHFLFNALNSISQIAVLEGAEKTPEAIYSLSVLLRRSMKQDTGLIPLREELRFVQEYIHIKKYFGREDIQYIAETEPLTEEVLVPPLIIQPLVENSLKHGLEPLGRGGTVAVSVFWQDQALVISVTDDGTGFDPRTLPAAGGELSGVGFPNVLERMRLFFGSNFECEVISRPGDGTTVIMRIPVSNG